MRRLRSLSRGGVKLALIIQIINYLDTVVLSTTNNKEAIFEDITEGFAGFVCQVVKEYFLVSVNIN